MLVEVHHIMLHPDICLENGHVYFPLDLLGLSEVLEIMLIC